MRFFYDFQFTGRQFAVQQIVTASTTLAPGHWLTLLKGCASFQSVA
jgi:hypothetical protein